MWKKIKKYIYIFVSGVLTVIISLFLRRKKISGAIKENERVIKEQKEKTKNIREEYENLIEENNNKIKESKEGKKDEKIFNDSSDAASFIDNIIGKSESSESGKN